VRFEILEHIPHPPREVYRVMRDELARLLPLLPNIDAIEILERKEEGPGVVHVVSRWTARGQVPVLARPFIPKRYFTWLDDARWEDESLLVRYRLETALPEVFQCQGVNAFREASGGTEVALTGEIHVDLGRMRGLPSLLRVAAPRVAAYLTNHIRPNLVNLTRAVDRYLRGAAPPL
jgi:hypothetical protein